MRRQRGVLERLLRESPDDVAVSAMTEAELVFGAMRSSQPARTQTAVADFLEPIEVLPFDSAAAHFHAKIRLGTREMPIGERDTVIASVAMAGGLVLVTHNAREFSRIEGLVLDDWTLPD